MTRRFRPIFLLSLLASLVLRPGPAGAQEGSSSLGGIITGAALGAATGVALVGPAGRSILGSDAAVIGSLTGAGILVSLLSLPPGTRYTASIGVAAFDMSELRDEYQFVKEEETRTSGTEEPGLGAEWILQLDVPIRQLWWAGLELAVLNDAASVTSSEVVCNQPGDCQRESRLVAESLAQTVVLAATARRRLGTEIPVFARVAVGAGLAGLSAPLVTGLDVLEGLDEVDTAVAPYGEVGLEAGGMVNGSGPDIQIGFRMHPAGDFDYSPVSRAARGSGNLDFSGFFARLGWSF